MPFVSGDHQSKIDHDGKTSGIENVSDRPGLLQEIDQFCYVV